MSGSKSDQNQKMRKDWIYKITFHFLSKEYMLAIYLRYYFANKGPSSQDYGFSCGHVWMWDLDCEESWAPKNCAGIQPRLTQGIRRRDGIGDLFI